MGTNYYTQTKPPCGECGRPHEGMHIGKSSGGWAFIFAPYPEEGLTTAASWREYLKDRAIVDEYEAPITNEAFWEMVERKKGGITAKTATVEQYGCYHDLRDKYEYLDAEGYRFSRTAGFS